jgi:hypothetical protein
MKRLLHRNRYRQLGPRPAPTEAEQRHIASQEEASRKLMERFDAAPQQVRQAIIDCPHYVDVGPWQPRTNPDKVTRLIRGVKTIHDAIEVTRMLKS